MKVIKKNEDLVIQNNKLVNKITNSSKTENAPEFNQRKEPRKGENFDKKI